MRPKAATISAEGSAILVRPGVTASVPSGHSLSRTTPIIVREDAPTSGPFNAKADSNPIPSSSCSCMTLPLI